MARTILLVVGVLHVASMHLFYGNITRLEPMYLTWMILSLYFLKRRVAVLVISVIILIYTFIICLHCFVEIPIVLRLVRTGPIAHFVFAALSMIFLTVRTFNEGINFNKMLSNSNNLLEKRNQELKAFNHIVSHDLKEPIRSIVSFSELLKESDLTEEKREAYLEKVISSGVGLNMLVDGIRQFQEVDRIELELEEIDLNSLIIDVRASLEKFISDKNARIEFRDLPTIHCCRSAQFVLFKNLIENGIKYNDRDQPLIEISAKQDEMAHYVYIRDNGIGIPEEYFDQVFIMFQRLHPRSRYEGTGLGMSICQKIVDRLGYELSIESSVVGEGTVFMLRMPFEH